MDCFLLVPCTLLLYGSLAYEKIYLRIFVKGHPFVFSVTEALSLIIFHAIDILCLGKLE
jgi:hypothetical protein